MHAFKNTFFIVRQNNSINYFAMFLLITAMPNDGCYSKQRATSYVYFQTFCVSQRLRMRYWVMMPNEAGIRMLVH